jgi:hypothetical protein
MAGLPVTETQDFGDQNRARTGDVATGSYHYDSLAIGRSVSRLPPMGAQ